MSARTLAALLVAMLAAGPARADESAADRVRRLAESIRAGEASAAPLNARLRSLGAALKTLAGKNAVPAEAAAPVERDADSLALRIERAHAAPPAEREQARDIAARALALLDGGAAGEKRDFAPAFPPPDAAALAAFRKRAAAMAAVMGAGGFDGPPSAAPEDVPLPAARPAAARESKPAWSARTATLQTALSAFLKSERQRGLKADGLFGPATEKAVRRFQARAGLDETGVIDRDTETALLSRFPPRRARRVRADASPRYYEGGASDFEPGPGARTIDGVLATVYAPFLAKTKKDRRREGATVDAHDQTICTLERHLAGACPYVSVAIDPRLKVPNGTPALIPEISALAGRTVLFRIVDTGSRKRFKGTGHIDVATDSDQRGGWGAVLSGGRFTVVLPQGLHPAR